jgi:hypothetical protein
VTDIVALCWAFAARWGRDGGAGLFRLLSEGAVITMKRKKLEI